MYDVENFFSVFIDKGKIANQWQKGVTNFFFFRL